MSKEIENNKIVYLDYLRVLSTFAVIILHVAASNWYNCDVKSYEWQVFNIYDSIVRFGVPIFLMISGSLFLKKEISLKKIYSKYILRLFIAFLVWGFIYYIFNDGNCLTQLSNLFKPGWTNCFVTIIKGHFHLWFLPLISGIYACIPIIRQIVKNQKILEYFLVLSFISWILIPQVFSLINDFGSDGLIKIKNALEYNVKNMHLEFFMSYIFYFVLGYYLSNRVYNKKQRILIYIAGIIGAVFTIVITLFVSIKFQKPTGTYYNNSTLNVLLEVVAIFVLFKNIQFNNIKMNKIISKFAKWSFGTYLVHMLVFSKLEKFGLNTLSFNPCFTVPIISLIIFIIGNIISFILNKIPILKKYIV